MNLPVLTDRARERYAPQKGVPAIIVKKERKLSKEEQAKAFRLAVWKRDDGKSRATGKKLVKSGTMDGDKLGEVDHAIPRSLAPDRLYDVSNGILLSKNENRLRKAVCLEQPEYRIFDYSGPDNRALHQQFVWRDPTTGTVTKRRTG